MTSNAAHAATLHPNHAAALSSLHVIVEELCEAQDAATMQIIAIADLARMALHSEADNAASQLIYALDAIRQIAAEANANLDAAQIEISDARVRDAARRGGAAQRVSPFGYVAPL